MHLNYGVTWGSKVISWALGQWGGADLWFLSPHPGHQPKPQDHGYGAIALRGMPVYFPAFAGTR